MSLFFTQLLKLERGLWHWNQWQSWESHRGLILVMAMLFQTLKLSIIEYVFKLQALSKALLGVIPYQVKRAILGCWGDKPQRPCGYIQTSKWQSAVSSLCILSGHSLTKIIQDIIGFQQISIKITESNRWKDVCLSIALEDVSYVASLTTLG